MANKEPGKKIGESCLSGAKTLNLWMVSDRNCWNANYLARSIFCSFSTNYHFIITLFILTYNYQIQGSRECWRPLKGPDYTLFFYKLTQFLGDLIKCMWYAFVKIPQASSTRAAFSSCLYSPVQNGRVLVPVLVRWLPWQLLTVDPGETWLPEKT